MLITKITPKSLTKIGFKNIVENKFESYPLHNYWVKNGVCLFYNPGDDENYLFGYAEMRINKYYAVGVRWIKYMEELKEVYLVLINEPLIEEKNEKN